MSDDHDPTGHVLLAPQSNGYICSICDKPVMVLMVELDGRWLWTHRPEAKAA